MQPDKEKLNNRNSKISKQIHIKEISENGEVRYNCTVCRKTFRSRSQRYYHINCNQLENLFYKCEHCNKSFSRLSQWKYHTESHLSPVNECQKCQKTFSNPLALKKHLTLHKVQPKLCPHCDKSFKKKCSLDQHIASQHLNQLQFGCAYCSKKYASKSTLHLHLQTHEIKRFECTFCGKFFQRNSILNLHLKRHYNTNNYKCTVCLKVFSESGALARHRKIHEESAIQYYCKLCEKSILRKDNMIRHLNTVHPEESFDNIVKIIRPAMAITNKTAYHPTEEITDYNIFESEDENFTHKTDKNVVIIENKLLQKPFDKKHYKNDLPEVLTNNVNTDEYPLMKQIKVITAVPTYQQEIINENIKNGPQELTEFKKTTNEQEIQTASYDFNNTYCKVIEQIKNTGENVTLSHQNQTHFKNLGNRIEEKLIVQESSYVNEDELKVSETVNLKQRQQKFETCEQPNTQAISSVIRSVGNVKKNLTSNIVITTKLINQTSLEYKHKKYCRSNYNIDLYRKILGCDEEDENVGEYVEHQQNSMHTQSEKNMCDEIFKSSAQVHWRKSFKNNYETSVP